MKLKIPPPLQTLIASFLMYLLDGTFPVYLGGLEYAWVIIAFVLLLSLFLLAPAVLSFIKNKTTVNPLRPERASALVVNGVYSFSRNPMYLGMAGFLLAWCFYLANPVNVSLFFLYIFFMTQFQIKPEEQALTELFGEDFRKYSRKVRRWI